MKNKFIWRTGMVLVGVTLLLILLGVYFSNRIEDQVDEVIGRNSTYQELDVDLLQGNVHIKELHYKDDNRELIAEEIFIKGFRHWKYIMEGSFGVQLVEVRKPEMILRPHEQQDSASKTSKIPDFLIDQFRVTDGTLLIPKEDASENTLFLGVQELQLFVVENQKENQERGIPFSYKSYNVNVDSVRVQMNPEHQLQAGMLKSENGRVEIHDFQIIPLYNKNEFDRKIPFEKDRITLRVDQVYLDSLQIDYRKDTLYLKDSRMRIEGADLDIYRNKTLPDDPSIKTMYSQKIRRSPVKFKIDSVQVRNAGIRYEERVKQEGPPAIIRFSGLEANISSVLNTELNRREYPVTTIQATALFMDRSEIELDWSFDVTNKEEEFRLSGEFGTVEGESMNSLLKPAMGMEATGALQSVWFTFSGDSEVLQGDVRVNYDKFKLNVLREDGKEKNKLLSALVNLFVDNDGVSGTETQNVRVNRDKSRSFWNYVWTGLKKGVIDALAQI